jgi:hypothetical protein
MIRPYMKYTRTKNAKEMNKVEFSVAGIKFRIGRKETQLMIFPTKPSLFIMNVR